MNSDQKPPSSPGREDIRRILAIRLDNIGDVVMLGPALRSLRHAFPDSSITLMCSPAGIQVTPLLPWVDETIVHRAVWQDASDALPLNPGRELALVDEIASRSFDAAFIFTSFSQSPYPPAWVCYLAGIPHRIGQSKEFGGGALSQWVKPPPDDTHQIDRNLHLLSATGVPTLGRHLELTIPKKAQTEADDLLEAVGIDRFSSFVLLAPGASCDARRYGAERFAQAADALHARTTHPVVLVGSERERAVADAASTAAGAPTRSLVGQTTVPQLAAVISRAGVVVTNHSGPMHLADAFLRPVVVVFSGTDLESQWRPRNSPARVLRRPTWCSPCHLFRCPYQKECLDVPVEEVVDSAIELLDAHATAEGAVRRATTAD